MSVAREKKLASFARSAFPVPRFPPRVAFLSDLCALCGKILVLLAKRSQMQYYTSQGACLPCGVLL